VLGRLRQLCFLRGGGACLLPQDKETLETWFEKHQSPSLELGGNRERDLGWMPPPRPSSRFALRVGGLPQIARERAQGKEELCSTGDVVDERAERFT